MLVRASKLESKCVRQGLKKKRQRFVLKIFVLFTLSLPFSAGPKCSAAGEGGGDGGKLVVSSTTMKPTIDDEPRISLHRSQTPFKHVFSPFSDNTLHKQS